MTELCPSCKISRNKDVKMLLNEGVPPYLDIRPIAQQHPLVVVRAFANRAVESMMKNIEKNIYYYKCPECGHIDLREKV
jgi:exosome complex RNA-binding protein Csl4